MEVPLPRNRKPLITSVPKNGLCNVYFDILPRRRFEPLTHRIKARRHNCCAIEWAIQLNVLACDKRHLLVDF